MEDQRKPIGFGGCNLYRAKRIAIVKRPSTMPKNIFNVFSVGGEPKKDLQIALHSKNCFLGFNAVYL